MPKEFYAEKRKIKFLRIMDFEAWMENFIQQNGIKNNEVFLIDHSSVTSLLTSKEIAKTGIPVNIKKLDNSRIVSIETSETAPFKARMSTKGSLV